MAAGGVAERDNLPQSVRRRQARRRACSKASVLVSDQWINVRVHPCRLRPSVGMRADAGVRAPGIREPIRTRLFATGPVPSHGLGRDQAMSTTIVQLGRLCAVAIIVGNGCAYDEVTNSQSDTACRAPAETYVSSRSESDGREIVVERMLPVQDNCEGIVLTRLQYDRHGVLIRRGDEHRRCGVIEESVTAVRNDRGWTIERTLNFDHDERMDERSVSFLPIGEVEPSELRDPIMTCAVNRATSLRWVVLR